MSLRVIYAGTPEFAEKILETLLQSPHTISLVLTQPDRKKGRGQKLNESPVKLLAKKNNLPVFQPERLKDPVTQQKLRDEKPDLMIVVAYGLILPKEVLSIPKYGCINVHASLLPHYRGAAPIQHAILAGEALTGVTIMQMDEGLDTGDILAVSVCPIEIHETSETLYKRLSEMSGELLLNTLQQLEEGNLKPEKQDSRHASYAPKISKEDAKINWNESAQVILRKIRAFNPWPVAYTVYPVTPVSPVLEGGDEGGNGNGNGDGGGGNQDLRLRIFDAYVLPLLSDAEPGTIIKANEEGIDVATGNDTLRITECQLPGGKRLKTALLLQSKSDLFQVGKKFGS